MREDFRETKYDYITVDEIINRLLGYLKKSVLEYNIEEFRYYTKLSRFRRNL